MNSEKSIISSLYDFKLESLVTPRILRFFYALWVGIASVATVLVVLASLITFEGAESLLVILLVPIAYLAYLALARIWFEYLTIIFKIHQNTEFFANKNSTSED